MSETATTPGRLLSLDEWDALGPVEARRMELVDGVVIMSPRPTPLHTVIAGRLYRLLSRATDGEVLFEPELVVAESFPATVRCPDLAVLRPGTPIPEEGRWNSQSYLLIIEIVSPGSRRTDYVAKRYDYEQAGIPFYWIIDPAERQVSCLELVDGVYQEVPLPTDDPVALPQPIAMTVTWHQLLGQQPLD